MYDKSSSESVRACFMRLEERLRISIRDLQPLFEYFKIISILKVLIVYIILEKDVFEQTRQDEQDKRTISEQQSTAIGTSICQLTISKKRCNSDLENIKDKKTLKPSKHIFTSALWDVLICMPESVDRQDEHHKKTFRL